MRPDIKYRGAMRPSVIAAFVLFIVLAIARADAADDCVALGQLVSTEGSVEIRRVGAPTAFAPASANRLICAGDEIYVHVRSRAALRLENETVVRLDQNTRLVVVRLVADGNLEVDLTQGGAIHVITRVASMIRVGTRPSRGGFRVVTPFVNANVEGTEFSVRVAAPTAVVTVVEGAVEVSERTAAAAAGVERPIYTVKEREQAEFDGARLVRVLTIRPRDAVQWALYYPAVFDERVRAGPAAAAGELLGVGRVDEAEPLLKRIVATQPRDPASAGAYALLAIIAVVRDQKDDALTNANTAVAIDPASAAARIALSYALQAQFRIDEALDTLLQIAPDTRSATSWARIAELELSTGNVEGARAAASRALELDASTSRAYSMLGYAHLLATDISAASQAFENAISRDQSDPFARLGLGLTRIRGGDLTGGRELLELTAILDPGSSLIRSYLGKAHFDERRDALAARQYEIAKRLDDNDPTHYLYRAVLMQILNRPVDALADLNESSRRNDNRAVYRSSLLVDDDDVVRSTNRASIYLDLGLEKLSIAESAKAVVDNFTNNAAHRQLAASYLNVPRHDVARVSEALQAQLRQPLTIVPVDPLLSLDNLVIPREVGPSRLSMNEYTQLYSRNQVRMEAAGISGSRSTLGDQITLSAIADRYALALSQLHYETDGFQDDNTIRKDAYAIFVQNEVSPRLSLQFDLRQTKFELTQPFFRFDPDITFTARVSEHNDHGRVGGRYTFDAASDLIWSVFYQDRTRIASVVPDDVAFTRDDASTASGELQYTRQLGIVQLTAGLVAVHEKITFPMEQAQIRTRAFTPYIYGTWGARNSPVKLVAGLSWDKFRLTNTLFEDLGPNERRRANPKLGVLWSPTPATMVRAAYATVVKRPFVASQTLEPTQIAGFNQFFTGYDILYGDRDGTISRRGGIAVDQRLGKDWYTGAEATARRLSVFNFNVGENDWHERTAYAYLYRTFAAESWRWQGALTLDYEYEKLKRPHLLTGPEGIIDVSTHRLQFGVRAFDRSGLTIRATSSYVRQSGSFSADISLAAFNQSDSGWVTDTAVDYRLPGRLGTVGIGARNIFDTRVNVFETDPINPRFATRRLVYAKAQLVF